jgi:hypothetical protein
MLRGSPLAECLVTLKAAINVIAMGHAYEIN